MRSIISFSSTFYFSFIRELTLIEISSKSFNSILGSLSFHSEFPKPMILIWLREFTFILSAVLHIHNALNSMIMFPLAYVFRAIRPFHCSFTFSLVPLPLTIILTLLCNFVFVSTKILISHFPLTLTLSIIELTDILISISILNSNFSLKFAILKEAFILKRGIDITLSISHFASKNLVVFELTLNS